VRRISLGSGERCIVEGVGGSSYRSHGPVSCRIMLGPWVEVAKTRQGASAMGCHADQDGTAPLASACGAVVTSWLAKIDQPTLRQSSRIGPYVHTPPYGI